MATPSPVPAFRVFGFPVHVRTGFLLFMALVVLINGTDIGLWLAGFMALFTLVHELGHAFAARATGAQAEIALDFMAGYAAFVPTRPLARWERAGISLAGPAAQIVIGGATYLAMHGEWSLPQADQHLQIAVLWAGPVIGAFNLIPVLPFDGGNILEQLVSLFTPHNARRVMIWFTVAVVGCAVVYSTLNPAWRPYTIFMIIPLLSVAQMRSPARDTQSRATQQQIARAEALAWATGDVSRFPAGAVPSPWFRAHQQLTQGNAAVARDLLLDDLRDDGPADWWPPDAAPREALEQVAALLPASLPVRGAFRAYVLADVLLRVGRYEQAAAHAAKAYGSTNAPMHAIQVARAAAALGDSSVALGWLRAATGAVGTGQIAREALITAVAAAHEFDALRHDGEFVQALAAAR